MVKSQGPSRCSAAREACSSHQATKQRLQIHSVQGTNGRSGAGRRLGQAAPPARGAGRDGGARGRRDVTAATAPAPPRSSVLCRGAGRGSDDGALQSHPARVYRARLRPRGPRRVVEKGRERRRPPARPPGRDQRRAPAGGAPAQPRRDVVALQQQPLQRGGTAARRRPRRRRHAGPGDAELRAGRRRREQHLGVVLDAGLRTSQCRWRDGGSASRETRNSHRSRRSSTRSRRTGSGRAT